MSFVSELFKSCYVDSLTGLKYCQIQWPLIAGSIVTSVAIPAIIRYTNLMSYGGVFFSPKQKTEISPHLLLQECNPQSQPVSEIDPLIKVNKLPKDKTQMRAMVGENVGFQNGGIDCAVCCALYGLFVTTDAFDSIFLEDLNNQDNVDKRNIKNRLIEMVNLIRPNSFVSAEKVSNFRELLEIYGGLTSGLTDPEAVINSMVIALDMPRDTVVTLNPAFSMGGIQQTMNDFLTIRQLETPEPFTDENTRVLIVQAQNQPGEHNEHIPSLNIQVEEKNYRLAAINVFVNNGHYITYSLLPEQKRVFRFDPHPGESSVKECKDLFFIIEGYRLVDEQTNISDISEQWHQITHAAQYIYVRS